MRRGFRKETAEVRCRQQQVGRGAAPAEAVAQRIHEDLRRSHGRRGIQRRQAQRLPEAPAQAAALAMAIEQGRHRAIVAEAVVRVLQETQETNGADFLGQTAATRAQQTHRQVPRSRQARQPHPEGTRLAGREAQFEWQAFQEPLGIGADFPHQAQRLAVSADQEVLPVVEPVAVQVHAARPPAELLRGLENGDPDPGLGQFDRRGQPRPAATDDRGLHPRTQVRQAIHSLRIGVSEVRWLRT